MSNKELETKNIEVFVNRANAVSIKETNERGQYGMGDTIVISYDQIDKVINALQACKNELDGL